MNSKIHEKLHSVSEYTEELIINFNKERWNFFTNATTENRKRYVNAINEFTSYLCSNSDLILVLDEFKKSQSKFKSEEQKILGRLKNLRNVYASNSQLSFDFINSQINSEMIYIDDRIEYNNKDATTSHLADLAEHETALKDIINLQKLFFSHASKYLSPVTETIKLRNEYFRERGYENYLDYFCKSSGTTEKKLRMLIDKVDKMTIDSYKKIKSSLEATLEKKLKCQSRRTPAYIYGDPFFRFYPVHVDENVNMIFKGKDVAYASRKFFEHMGVSLDEVFEVSDLYIRPGKYQGNLIVDIDRESDVRFSVNSKSNFRGMYNLLRTLSKVVFTLNYDKSLSFMLRTIPDRGVAEGFGMYLADYAFQSGFISKIIAQYEEEDEQTTVNVSDYIVNNRIVYIRFFLALAEFEITLNSSNEADYASLWMKAVKKYQLIETDTILEKNGWVMLDSIIIDPFSSIFELEGFIRAQQIEKHIPEKQATPRHIMMHLINNVVSKCVVSD
ncbi:MAG: hypothetical protein PHW02_02240 [bacterium]|nr:hypothetical protein [bacterium]